MHVVNESEPAETRHANATPHFKDGRFSNPGVPDHTFGQLLQWIRNRKPGPWREWIPSTPGPQPPERVAGTELRVTFINHATLLIQTHGLNLLTDPVWSMRASPVQWTGPKRHRDPGIRFEDLPPIDALLISHNHYDHFDRPTLRRLGRDHRPVVFCPLGVARSLRGLGFAEAHELDWWQSVPWQGVQMHCIQAQHFAARTPFDRNRTLWCGWMMEASGGSVYFAGDTGFGGFFREIRERFGPLRLTMLPIGAYEPEWFMGPVHMTPEQAVEAWTILEAKTAIPIHYGTFSLADDGETAPLERLERALADRTDSQQFRALCEGEGQMIPEL
jgi:L-ascorbate metabolism protein UlaG (beta-lactamase superfamily)